MKKIKYSDFESIHEIIGQIDLKYDQSIENNKSLLFEEWKNIIGEKISSLSKPVELSDKNLLKISCANSFVANELFMQKQNLIVIINEKAKEYNLKVRDLIFDYKSWKQN